MKVVYISSTHFDDSSFIGGTERYVFCLAKHLASYCDTTVVSFSSSRESKVVDGVRLELYPARHHINAWFKDPINFRYLECILDSDIVHIHNLNLFVTDLGALAGFLLGKPTVVTDHKAWHKGVLSSRLPVHASYRKAIAYSLFGLNEYPPVIQRKCVLIKGGVDTSKFRPVAPELREKKILFAGRIAEEKGIRYLIEAFRLLKRTNYELVIIGRVYDPPYYEELIRLSEGLPVKFIHDADDETLLHQFQTATVTVLPSLFKELMGLVILESQACGTPVICSDSGAMHEFVVHGETGYVVPKADSNALAEALERLLSVTREEEEDRRSRCRQWARSYDWRQVAAKHMDVYRSLV